jgi:hypothetical protein
MRLVLPQVLAVLVAAARTTLLRLVLETHLQHPHRKVTTVVRVQLDLLKPVGAEVALLPLVLLELI